MVQHVVLVNPDRSSLHAVGNTQSRVEVGCVHCGSKAVVGGVTHLDCFFLSLELGNRANRAEDLLLHNLHLRCNIREDSRLDEVTLCAVTLASSLDSRTLFLASINVAHNAIVLKLGDLWALEGVGEEGVANLVGQRASLELLDKLVIDAFLDVNTGTGAAALAVVVEDTEVDPSIFA